MTDLLRAESLMIVGGQWGDEGKGKVVDLLSAGFKAVVRYNGGHNAGHTVRFADRRFALHLVPSGIIHPDVICYLGAGMVIDPLALVAELNRLAAEGIDYSDRLFLSSRATLILPTHGALDNARESARGASAIGTTGRGIGPSYQDIAQRRGLRAYLMADTIRLAEEAEVVMEVHNRELDRLFAAPTVDISAGVEELCRCADILSPHVKEVGPAIMEHADRGEALLFEGAQGVLLDIYHGSYPYVTSSSCLPGTAATSCGIPPRLMGPVVGIMKAYITRVGGGPFPSEVGGELGEFLRAQGNEFGTTTGRPRRCGWFDGVAARYAVRVAGLDAVAMMKLDVLDGLETIPVATGYRLSDGTRLDEPPADPEMLARVEPVLEELPGWKQPTVGLTDTADLPPEASAYVDFLEQQIGAPIVIVSTGPRRRETMVRGDTALARRLGPIIEAALSLS